VAPGAVGGPPRSPTLSAGSVTRLQSGNWPLTSASGSYTEPAQPENHCPGCTASLTRNASAAAMLGSFGPNVITRRSGYWTVEVFPPTYTASATSAQVASTYEVASIGASSRSAATVVGSSYSVNDGR
jgi:hypothetical protein